MNQKIKISQLPAKGSNLAAQDLIEIAEFTGTGYVSKSITGQEIIDAAVGNVDWGDIGGTLSAQTDLQNALDAKQDDITLTTTGSSGASTLVGSTLNVPNYTLSGLGGVPTSRTLTINGVTQDLSANRTFTISTGITIGSTAIASGVVGRVLFEGTGNVVQQSSSLFWDATNNRLGIGTSSPSTTLHVVGQATISTSLSISGGFVMTEGGNVHTFTAPVTNRTIRFITNSQSFSLFPTGNFAINTTTDAGFRLDVNGTARIDQTLRINGTGTGTAIQFPGGRIDADTNWIRIKSPTNQDLINVANNFVGINATTVIASAIFAITSTNRGFLPPRMTTTEKNAIASPAAGLMVYDTTLNVISYYNGSMWI